MLVWLKPDEGPHSFTVPGAEKRSGSDKQVWVCDGEPSKSNAWLAIYAASAATITNALAGTLYRQSIELERIKGCDTWQGTVNYGTVEPKQYSFEFETGGDKTKVIKPIARVSTYSRPTGSPAPACDGIIGLKKQGRSTTVEGVEIVTPVFNFGYTFKPTVVSDAYIQALYLLTGKVNTAAWKGFGRCEVLFMGASGKQSGDEWEISLKFSASPSTTGITVGDITGISKLGWEYLWVLTQEHEDVTAFCLTEEPIGVYVDQVYEYGSFASLGIGI